MIECLRFLRKISLLPRFAAASFALVGATLLLAGCGQAGGNGSVQPTSTSNSGSSSQEDTPIKGIPTVPPAIPPATPGSIGTPRVSYAEPSTGPILSQPLSSMTITPLANPASLPPLTPDASGTLVVTSNDYGRLVEMKVGDTLKLNLGAGYDWTVPDVDTSILALVTPSPAGQSGQETYKAVKPGKTTLQASGEPPCRKAQPPCGAPSRAIELHITVK